MAPDTTKVFVPVAEQMIFDWSAVGIRRLERYLARCAAFEEYCRATGREWSSPEPFSCQPQASCR